MHATSPFARRQRLAFLPVVVGVLGGTANADENAPGPGNVLAMEIAGRSALVRSAKAFIDQHIGEIRDDKLRAVTADAIVNPATYIRHRASFDALAKAASSRRWKPTASPIPRMTNASPVA